jgi:hypothetical protein
MRTIVTIFTVILLSTPATTQQAPGCPTTASQNPSTFVPPAPHEAVPVRGSFWYGSDRLWTRLNEDGRWHGLYRPDLRAYRNKVMLFRENFDSLREHRPPITITASNLDGRSQPVVSERASGAFNEDTGPMIMTALDLPQAGCWLLTARYADERPLTFVVSVP